MSITNEQLSAFLDDELSEADMQTVRDAIANDIGLADKLAALAEVDVTVKAAAEKATETALPKSVLALLEEGATPSSDNWSSHDSSEDAYHKGEKSDKVLRFPAQRKKRKWYAPVAVAASFAALAGLVFIQQDSAVAPGISPGTSQWASVSSVLDTKLTGESETSASGVKVTPQLSFLTADSTYCRQAEVVTKDEKNTLIACLSMQNGWQLMASSLQAAQDNTGAYQAANKADVLKDELDNLMKASPLNRAQEQRAIESKWLMKNSAQGVKNEN